MTTRPPADVGMPVAEIDTPALLVDLDAYERNLDRMAASLAGTPVRLRGHARPTSARWSRSTRSRAGAVGVVLPEGERGRGDGVRRRPERPRRRTRSSAPGRSPAWSALARQAEVAVCVDDPRTSGTSARRRARSACGCRCWSRSTSGWAAAASCPGSRPSRWPATSPPSAGSASPGSRPTTAAPSTSTRWTSGARPWRRPSPRCGRPPSS